MTTKSSQVQIRLGTLIDGGALKLVEVLGVGGYGVVYRAVETRSPHPQSFAVKCLLHDQTQPSMRRQLHIREIALHQISSAHPGVITLHRVIEDSLYTYIVMDYAPDHDLFTQILNNCRYLGDNTLIKHVFMQLLDAIEYCHSLGIYHRDLKPENVLCFDKGSRIAITDFGLATTEKMSEEMRTGSIYHMSPECQGLDFTGVSNQAYSPMFNDVWSLGIILLNLATGRNPWKTATMDDLTFQAYLRDPMHFFPSVLPVSHEINEVLIRTLNVDWTERMTLAELRQEMEDIENFYAPDVIFDGSQAHCLWEVAARAPPKVPSIREETKPVPIPAKPLKSHWSDDSRFGSQHTVELPDWLAEGTGFVHPSGVQTGKQIMAMGRPLSQSSGSSYCSYSTSPSTPDSNDVSFASCQQAALEEIMQKRLAGPSDWQSTSPASAHFDATGSLLYQHNPSTSFDLPMFSPTPDGCAIPHWNKAELTPTSGYHAATPAMTCDDPFASSAAPSPDSYLWPMDPVTFGDQTQAAAFDPMNLYSQPQSIPKAKQKAFRHSANAGLAPYSTQFLQQPAQTHWAVKGDQCQLAQEKHQRAKKAGVARKKASPFDSIKFWLLPGRFMS